MAAVDVQFYEESAPAGSARTDADGLGVAQLTLDHTQPWLGLTAISGAPGDEHFAVASTAWQDGIGPWEFDIQASYSVDRMRSAFYTDRPIYRPGQTV